MSNFINLHFIQSVPASLMNRDNENSAKSIKVGKIRRDRISSQSWKRSIRTGMREEFIENGTWGTRTNRLPRLVIDKLVAAGRDRDTATVKTLHAFTESGISCHESKPQTNVQLYVSERAVELIAQLIDANFDAITDNVDNAVKNDIIASLDPDGVVDIALFGRFIAELKRAPRIDGAVSVSSPFGVTAATVEHDFWTAVDDVREDAESASSNMGFTELTSPVLYRHIVIDKRQLDHNLPSNIDRDEVIRKLIKHAVVDSPAAKHTTTAANTLPAVVVAVNSDVNLSLAANFTRVVTDDDVISASVQRIMRGVQRINVAVLGTEDAAETVILPLSDEADDVLDSNDYDAELAKSVADFAQKVTS